MQPDDKLRRGGGQRRDTADGQLITCRLDELHPHPSYVRHQLSVPASKLSALAERGDLAFREPIVITQGGIIIDGYARFELARRQNRTTLPCRQYELTEAEALDRLVESHHRSGALNAFCRTLLALDLESWFKERARSNQRAGGRNKGSAKLTEAERLDVRAEIASVADVSVGNVSKVKQLVRTAGPELLQALRSGEISIHWARENSKRSPKEQREALWLYQNTRGVKKAIRNLVSRHRSKRLPSAPDVGSVVRRLSAQEPRMLGAISVAVIKVPGRILCLSEELWQTLGPQEELRFTCDTKTP